MKDCRRDRIERLLLATIFKDAHHFHVEWLKCHAILNISKQDEMTLKTILEVEIFDLWGVNFMGPFPPLDEKEFILAGVDKQLSGSAQI